MTVMSMLKVVSRSQAVTVTVTYSTKVEIYGKRCKTETFLLQTTNRK